MIPVIITKSLAAAVANGVALSQSIGAAGNLTLSGSLMVAGVAVLDSPRPVIITSAGNDSGITFTVYGLNPTGNPVSETVAGAAIGVATTLTSFSTVTRVATSGATAAAVTVGTNGTGTSAWNVADIFRNAVDMSFAGVVTGTLNWGIEYTYDNPNDPATPIPTPFDHPVLVAKTVTADCTLSHPFYAWRLKINSGSGSIKLTGTQAGLLGG